MSAKDQQSEGKEALAGRQSWSADK